MDTAQAHQMAGVELFQEPELNNLIRLQFRDLRLRETAFAFSI